MSKQKLTSLAEIAKELGINKSKLHYYYSKGLFSPVARVGKMNVFDHKEITTTIKSIEKMQSAGVPLMKMPEHLPKK
jgi:DNA-binding transcriptional MerR regulator